MSTFTQTGPKRQKMRENRVVDNVDYFHGVEKVEYSSVQSNTDVLSYRYYNSSERLHGRTMEDWLKFSVSMGDFKYDGSEPRGRPTHKCPWDDHTDTIDNCKRTIKACFDFCTKLGIKYFTAFDTDLVPWSDNCEEWKSTWDEVLECLQENMARTHVKPLFIAPDLHSHPRYASGALTSPEASTYACVATQIKKCLEISQKLNCECFALNPYRETFENNFKTDIQREFKLLSKLLKMTAEYKERLQYRGQLLIMPVYRFDGKDIGFRDVNRYVRDVQSCMFLLKHYNLDRFFKIYAPVSEEWHFAYAHNMVGGAVVTDRISHRDIDKYAQIMECVIKQGSMYHGGINLQLTPRRDSTSLRDRLATYTRYIDAIARGLRVANKIVNEQELAKQIQQKYVSYYSGFGARVVAGEVSLEECEEQHKKYQQQSNEEVPSSKSEQFDVVCQKYLDAFDQI